MTTRRTYTCNLCGDGIDASGKRGDFTRAGVGIRFGEGNAVQLIRVDMAESHICAKCLRDLKAVNAVWYGTTFHSSESVEEYIGEKWPI